MQERSSLTLESPLQSLKGVGPERSKLLERLGLRTLGDLLHFFPRRYENRAPVKRIREAVPGEKECVQGVVSTKGLIRTKGGPLIFRVALTDALGGGALFGTWFNMPYLSNVFKPKLKVVLYGRVEQDGKNLKMIHPEYEIVPEVGGESIHSGRIVPVYGLTEDLSQKGLRQLQYHLREKDLAEETLPEALRSRLGLADAREAARQVHFPDTFESLERARRRLVFDEFFGMQVVIQMKRAKLKALSSALPHEKGEREVEALTRSLGFELTKGQRAAIADAVKDMRSGAPMNRLVQGDVGSGKTVVAAAALAFTAANGFQGALMAPTEVLAQQHALTLTRLLEPLGFRVTYLAQGLSPKERDAAREAVSSGKAQIVVGTHALIQEGVKFPNLGLAVIDEQHKFGVVQRAALGKAAPRAPHVLLMTATPIPRSLAMTLYGDLDLSTIAEMPKGRQPVKTFWVAEEKRAEVHAMIRSLLDAGRQAYVICPLVEAGPAPQKSAAAVHEELKKVFAAKRVGLLHGRMKPDEKKKTMADFKEKRIDVLVSTVVVEVGVDVPNATVMVIEDAERFGLAQLHQLRGRVGRGTEESFCVLFSKAAGEEAAERLEAFAATASGFDIAEKDLALRGTGDWVGERQSGLPEFRIGDLSRDLEILALARREAQALVEKDPKLASPENAPILAAVEARFRAPKEKLEAMA